MSYVRFWTHCVWGTKKRIPYFNQSNKETIFKHIKENARSKGIYIDFINGGSEHIHCLISIAPHQNIANIIQLIKGESSFWINKNKITKRRFEWADEYFAVSVSESQLYRVRNYIRNQEQHHSKRTWNEEYFNYSPSLDNITSKIS